MSSSASPTPSGSGSSNDPSGEDLRVFTLNCWGLKGVSKKRKERFAALGEWLCREHYDLVLLQEVWLHSDYDVLCTTLKPAGLLHSHFFDNGIIGSGTCVFSRVQIHDATFHEFTMNGYPHKVWHGDWFGGKGLGVCQIYYRGFDVHVYVSHYHAEYDHTHDVYLGHRVIHALESAQWIKLTSSSADLTVYAGDFNTEPPSVPYRLLRHVSPLHDAWQEVHGDARGGETSETPQNSFTAEHATRTCPDGRRIDYIMYRPGPNMRTETKQCELPLPDRVPGQNFSYSDHEAVAACFRLRRTGGGDDGDEQPIERAPDFRRSLSHGARSDCVRSVKEALEIITRSERYVNRDYLRYASLAGVLLTLLVASFFLTLLIEPQYHVVLDVCMFLPRFVVSVSFVYFVLMATLFNKRELNALQSTRKSLKLILNQDNVSKDELIAMAD